MPEPKTNTPVPTPQTNEQGFQVNAAPASPAAPDIQSDASAPAMPVQTAAVAPPAPVAPPDPETAHHTMIGKIFQSIAGGQKTVYDQTPQGPVPRKVDLQPGEVARTIVASAFSLIAAGAAGAQGHNIPHDITIGGMREDRDEQVRRQAQEQFQNKQAADRAQREQNADVRAADELTLSKARDLREQQDDIRKGIEFNFNQKREAFQLSHDQWQASLEQVKALNDWELLAQTDRGNGVKQAMIGGVPTPEFHSQGEMQDYITKNINALQDKAHVLSYRWKLNPDGTMTGTLVEEPRPDGPTPVGYKLGKDGQPLIDANGQRIPDGSIKGPDGKPTGFMAPNFTAGQQIATEQLRQKQLQASIEDLQAQAVERRQMHAKDDAYNKALADYTKHGGNVEAMDPGARLALIPKVTADWYEEGKMIAALEAQQAPADVMQEATRNFMQTSRLKTELMTQTNLGVLAAKQMRAQGVPDDKILNAIQTSKGLTKQDQAQAREYVIGGFTVDGINDMDKSQKQDIGVRLKNLGLAKGTAVIQSSTLPDADKQKLISLLQQSLNGAPATAASSVPAGVTRMSDGQLIPNDAVPAFLQKYPAITVAEKGPAVAPAEEIPYAPK